MPNTYYEWDIFFKKLGNCPINEEYINILNGYKTTNDNVDSNIKSLLINTLKNRLNNIINSITRNLEDLLTDQYLFELKLIELKKEIIFLNKIINTNILSNEEKITIIKKLQENIDMVYNILEEKIAFDVTGVMLKLLKDNRIKMEVYNEL